MEEINIYSSEMQVGVYKGVKNVDYLYKYKSFDNLLVMFNGAVDVSRAKYPVFQRKSFIEYINANILIINDNTLTEDNGLSLGWYQSAPEWNLQSDIVFLIKKYLMALEIKNESLFLYGSSAGGFIASIMATHFRGSTAIVNNPQVDVLKFFDSHDTILILNRIIHSCV
ncbi:hypothetical protein LA56_1016 [Francisella philomiragia]|uniref:hypothetical protein n=1 Tax=Francisella philomiragia TaxID=28110 RepID=UPI0005A56E8B|nr:hypothetical protein [Francisella philomiragia]AJI54738.1 hypothetical protein LA56_1016 [Francisella philomiragia]MBK2253743.1 hypothetical protein [Francisella philomiragia]